MTISGALIEAVVNLLRGLGLLQDPAQEVQVRRQLADLEKARADVWVDFVRATTPDAERVYVWANSVIALVRPAISALIVIAMVAAPSRMLDLVQTFGDAGPAGWIVMAPLLWWFLGRDVAKVLAIRSGGLLPVGSGAVVPADREALRRESQRRWERIDRLMEELSDRIGEPDLPPELVGPDDR
ncbi:MAG: hypothetical protein QN173_10535 [Armatimonadota bacterium]|nr:hypothetical protein [Armatimonadota bacterium]MDR7438182.1 hypothetical protein [Armatimonadota bacterium]MDR7473246.1 hypothetical protein [Armatimonadota bacterium]MDR7508029.1 hypothetical protein [Armatimonadota bacterium]MDR7582143.1 hypothetical protein [Armatimonadota bacterium]